MKRVQLKHYQILKNSLLGLSLLISSAFTQAQVETQRIKVFGNQSVPKISCPVLKKPIRKPATTYPTITGRANLNNNNPPLPTTQNQSVILTITEEDEAKLSEIAVPTADELRRNTLNPTTLLNFHERLQQSIKSTGLARVGLWGGSHMAAEFMPSEMRKSLQSKYGNGGPGHINLLFGRPGIRLPVSTLCQEGEWLQHTPPRNNTIDNQEIGLGLYSITSASRNASVEIDFRDQNDSSRTHQVYVYYLSQNQGGYFDVFIDDVHIDSFNTSGSEIIKSLKLVSDLPISKIKIVAKDDRRVSLLGVHAESNQGIILDNYGIPGASGNFWHSIHSDTLKRLAIDRHYDTIMLAYGTNDVVGAAWDSEQYQRKFTETLSAMRKLFPTQSCLIITPGDRASYIQTRRYSKNQRINKRALTRRMVDSYTYSMRHKRVADIQTAVGSQYQCATWNMSLAMRELGGAYEMTHQKPPLMANDLIHLTIAGYKLMAQKLNTFLGL